MNNEGSVYFIALMSAVGMSLMGVTLLTMALHGHTLARNHTDEEKSLALADGCVEVAERTLVRDWSPTARTLAFGASGCEFIIEMNGDKAIVTADSTVKRGARQLQAQFSRFPASPEGLTIIGPTTIGFNGNAFDVYQITTDSAVNTDLVSDALNEEQIDNIGTIVQDDSIAVGDMHEMARALAARADITLEGSVSQARVGSANDPVIAVTKGEVNMQGPMKGYGILIAFEPIALHGRMEWHGLVLALGGVQVSGEGGQAHIYGSIVVTDTTSIGGNSSIQPSDIGDIRNLIGVKREWWRDNG